MVRERGAERKTVREVISIEVSARVNKLGEFSPID
jgi:hypothetical protein